MDTVKNGWKAFFNSSCFVLTQEKSSESVENVCKHTPAYWIVQRGSVVLAHSGMCMCTLFSSRIVCAQTIRAPDFSIVLAPAGTLSLPPLFSRRSPSSYYYRVIAFYGYDRLKIYSKRFADWRSKFLEPLSDSFFPHIP